MVTSIHRNFIQSYLPNCIYKDRLAVAEFDKNCTFDVYHGIPAMCKYGRLRRCAYILKDFSCVTGLSFQENLAFLQHRLNAISLTHFLKTYSRAAMILISIFFSTACCVKLFNATSTVRFLTAQWRCGFFQRAVQLFENGSFRTLQMKALIQYL